MSREAYEALRDDEVLGPVVERHGPLSLSPADDLFERLVVAIVRQQVSKAAALAIEDRLFEAVEVTPEGILAADEETLRDAGLSGRKTRYVREAARTFLDRGWDRAHFEGRPDEAVIDDLTSVTGVGEWTARMQLLFALGRPDVFPVGDLGIRKGMEAVFDAEMTRAEMVAAAERWAPHRSHASLYLWRANRDGVPVDDGS